MSEKEEKAKRQAERMERKLLTKRGKSLCKLRSQMIEPVFGHIKARGCGTFMRRGLAAVRSEWRLICATHNTLKLFHSGDSEFVQLRTITKAPACA